MKSVLVSGCSAGIGRACAACLARDGWRVFAGVRSDADAQSVESDPGGLTAVQLDVTDAASIARARAQIEREAKGELDALVNNAGIAIGGALETVPPEELRRILDVNVVGQVAVSQALLPLLRRAGGRILFLGSVGGRVAFPYAGPYHASKFALEAVADSLRAELRPQGVSVSLLEPAVIDTPIWTKAISQVASLRAGLDPEARSLYSEELESFEKRLGSAKKGGAKPQKVAEKALKALRDESPASRYQVGRGAKTLISLRPLLPDALFDRLAQRFMARH
jgi:NAD(P)-dependent dehydrogenase (short-subunit alcohol dehydrogenase family)